MVLRSCFQGIHRPKKNIKRIKKWSTIGKSNFFFMFFLFSKEKIIVLLYEGEESIVSVWLNPFPPHDFRDVTLELLQFRSRHSFEMVFGTFPCSLDVICMDFNIFTSFLIDVRLFERELVYYSEMLKSRMLRGHFSDQPSLLMALPGEQSLWIMGSKVSSDRSATGYNIKVLVSRSTIPKTHIWIN